MSAHKKCILTSTEVPVFYLDFVPLCYIKNLLLSLERGSGNHRRHPSAKHLTIKPWLCCELLYTMLSPTVKPTYQGHFDLWQLAQPPRSWKKALAIVVRVKAVKGLGLEQEVIKTRGDDEDNDKKGGTDAHIVCVFFWLNTDFML